MKRILLILFSSILLVSCQDDLDDKIFPADRLYINNFIWNAMNLFYFYNSEVPDLGDERFSSNEEFSDFLSNFEAPEDLFDHLLIPTDRFSIIVSDFRVLESALQGTRVDSGMRFGLFAVEGSDRVFGFVRYVLPNSPAEQAGITRGLLFDRVNGQTLTQSSNFNQLFSGNSIQIGIAEFDEEELVSLDQQYILQQIELTENPIHKVEILDFPEKKVGYLMYTNFRRNFEQELNQVFAMFQSENIDELVLDLRYNGGGDLQVAVNLCSMITGQFFNELLATRETNDNFEDVPIFFSNETIGGQSLNSLQLSRVYVLTSRTTASASELVISGLQPFINLVQIGRQTSGKYQGSTTLYDSPNFGRQNASLAHRYALQPLIFKLVNSVGFTDYDEGIEPSINIGEQIVDAQALGSPTEALLREALLDMGIQIPGRGFYFHSNNDFDLVGENFMHATDYQRMYDKIDLLSE